MGTIIITILYLAFSSLKHLLNHFDSVKLAESLTTKVNKIKNETKDAADANRPSQMFNNYLFATVVRIVIFVLCYLYVSEKTEIMEDTDPKLTKYVTAKTNLAVAVQIISGNVPIVLPKDFICVILYVIILPVAYTSAWGNYIS